MDKIYGKYFNGVLVINPIYLNDPSVEGYEEVFNPTEEAYLAHGFKEMVYDECPECSCDYLVQQIFTELDTTIRVCYKKNLTNE